jgi:hypothetical protein
LFAFFLRRAFFLLARLDMTISRSKRECAARGAARRRACVDGVRLGPGMEAERAPADRECCPTGQAIGPDAVREHPPIKLLRHIGRNRRKHRAYTGRERGNAAWAESAGSVCCIRRGTGHEPLMRRLISAAALMVRDAKRSTAASPASAAGNVTATPASGCPAWSRTAAATDFRPGVTSPSSVA